MAGLKDASRVRLPSFLEAQDIVDRNRPWRGYIAQPIAEPLYLATGRADEAIHGDLMRPTIGAPLNNKQGVEAYGDRWRKISPLSRIDKRVGYADKAPIPNKTINRELSLYKDLRNTNYGQNPGAYVDPEANTMVHAGRLYASPEDGMFPIGGFYGQNTDKRVHVPSPMVAGTDVDENGRFVETNPQAFATRLVHESIHRNYDNRGGYTPEKGEQMRRLNAALMAEKRNALPNFTRDDINYGQSEPEAYLGSEEAMLPAGQLPVQEAMKKYGLDKVYAEQTVRGPVAFATEPTLRQRVMDWFEARREEKKKPRGLIPGY